MTTTATDIYVDSFLARCQAFLGSGGRAVDAPGIYGLLAEGDEPVARLLVTDDRGVNALPAVLRDAKVRLRRRFWPPRRSRIRRTCSRTT